MNYYALFYEVTPDYIERRAAFRALHLQHAQAAQQRDELVLAGAFSEPVDRALLVFRAEDKAVVENFARHDPYVINGLVTRWEVRAWTVVIGNQPLEGGAR